MRNDRFDIYKRPHRLRPGDKRKWPQGRVRPDDPKENTRDHERIWLAIERLRRRGTDGCGCDDSSGGRGGCFDTTVLDTTVTRLLDFGLDEESGNAECSVTIATLAPSGSPEYQQPGPDALSPNDYSIKFVASDSDRFTSSGLSIATGALTGSSLTIEATVLLSGLPSVYAPIAGRGFYFDISQGYYLAVNSTGNPVLILDGEEIVCPVAVTDGVWMLLTATYDDSTDTAIFYENGIELAQVAATTAPVIVDDAIFRIGRMQENGTGQVYHLSGYVARVIVYDGVSPPEEIEARAICLGLQDEDEGGGGGVTDHGDLTGLGDDDHPQYETTAEVAAQIAVHTGETTDAHAASAISVLDTAGDFTADNVEDALAELFAGLGGGGGGNGDLTVVGGYDYFIQGADDVSGAATTMRDVPGLVFTMEANAQYIIDLYLIYIAASNATGLGLAWNVSVATVLQHVAFSHAGSTAFVGGDGASDDATRLLSSGLRDLVFTTMVMGSGNVLCGGTGGTCQLRWRPEVAAVGTMKAGSAMRVMRIA